MQEPYGNYYATQQLAAHYEADHACRPDIPFYLALARELQAQVVADIGAGTGLLCSRLMEQGHQAIGVEPQATMLSLAQSQPHASDITWIQGTAVDLEDECANLILMTGHVAQYFLDQSAWVDVLLQARRALRPGGHVAFEIRNAAVEEWRGWADEAPRDTGWGTVRREILQDGDLITHVDHWSAGDRNWATSETLRFPAWDDVLVGIEDAGLHAAHVWGGWDRQAVGSDSREWIFVLPAV